jgi:hypothetical protein
VEQICGLRHPITRGRCVLVPGEHEHETTHGERWSTRPEDERDPVVKYDGDGQPVRRSQLPRSLRRR